MMVDFDNYEGKYWGEVDPFAERYSLRLLAAAPMTPKLVQGVSESAQVSSMLGFLMDEEPLTAKRISQRIRSRLREVSASLNPNAVPLHRNIAALGRDLKLSPAEVEVMRFALLVHCGSMIENTFELIRLASVSDLFSVVATACDLNVGTVKSALARRNTLHASGLVQVDRNWRFDNTIRGRLDVVERFGMTLASEAFTPEDLLSQCAARAPVSTLTIGDFDHLKGDLKLVQRVLTAALKRREPGINILLWGPPGTGKTEYARLLATLLDCTAREIVHEDDEGDPIARQQRGSIVGLAQRLLHDSPRTVLVFDEMEDLMSQQFRYEAKGSALGKAWFNNLLETNPVPTIWISNDADGFDQAVLRRFSLSVAFRVPPASVRKRIIRKQLAGLPVDDKLVAQLADINGLSAASVAQATRVARLIGSRSTKSTTDAVRRALAGTTDLMHLTKRPTGTQDTRAAIPYGLEWVNADADLSTLVRQMRTHKSARLCFYGAPGTGKSEFGRQLAKRLKRPLLVRRASDMMGAFVGQTEQLIARAFKEATATKSVLLIDEADSFIYSRESVTHAWQRSMVNEFLTQMEIFEGILICSTNMPQALDEASARRFDLQVRFGSMNPAQAWNMFRALAKARAVKIPRGLAAQTLRGRIEQLPALTPGDLAKAVRGGRLLEQQLDAEGLCSAVERVVASKSTDKASHAMGFVWEEKRAC